MGAKEPSAEDTAPVSGQYRLLNVFGSPTGIERVFERGETLPKTPRGYSWSPVINPSPPRGVGNAAAA